MEGQREKKKARGYGGVMFDETHSVVGLNEGVVDSNDLDVAVLDGVAEDDTSNTTEAVDADLDDHFD
jgi:hypothetical protein